MRWFHEIFAKKAKMQKLRNFHSVVSYMYTLWRLRNFCITIFWKNSVKTTSLVKNFTTKLISFHEIILKWYKNFVNSTLWCSTVQYCGTVWKNEKYSLNEKIFRQIISLVTSLVKPLLSRNFCQKGVRENFRNFHSVCGKVKNLLSPKKISSNQLYLVL